MQIGYFKLGRSWQLDPSKASTVGGDIDVIRLVKNLATKYPEHEFILIGRNTGQDPQSLGYPKNVINPWTEWRTLDFKIKDNSNEACEKVTNTFLEAANKYLHTMDHIIGWLGQHGSANSRIPMIGYNWDGELAKPQMSFVNYCGPILSFITQWRNLDPIKNEEIWLCPDPRNYLKARELAWPLHKELLAQFKFDKQQKHERYKNFEMNGFPVRTVRENSVIVSTSKYVYAGLELTALPAPADITFSDKPGPVDVGLIINENRKAAGKAQEQNGRLYIVKNWILKHFPDATLHGSWSEDSIKEIGREITSLDHDQLYEKMSSFKVTLTTPASLSGWATSKPWECFAAGTVCFFHPNYDTQGNVLPLRYSEAIKDCPKNELAKYLRVKNETDFVNKVKEVLADEALWLKIVTLQRNYYEESWNKWHGGALKIEQRMGLI